MPLAKFFHVQAGNDSTIPNPYGLGHQQKGLIKYECVVWLCR